MPILYSLNGMPVQVMPGMENDFLAKGYRTSPPKTQSAKVESSPAIAVPAPTPNLFPVAINIATLKEMSERLGLNTNQARAIRDNRPYDGIEDLIAVMPEIAWAGMDSMIDFQAEKE
jgi:hypothetical protein